MSFKIRQATIFCQPRKFVKSQCLSFFFLCTLISTNFSKQLQHQYLFKKFVISIWRIFSKSVGFCKKITDFCVILFLLSRFDEFSKHPDSVGKVRQTVKLQQKPDLTKFLTSSGFINSRFFYTPRKFVNVERLQSRFDIAIWRVFQSISLRSGFFRCRSPEELGAHMSTLKCQKCPEGLIMPDCDIFNEEPSEKFYNCNTCDTKLQCTQKSFKHF